MAIQGLRNTGNFSANERPENWRAGILLRYPNSAKMAKAPLTALTSLMKSRSTDDPKFHWWEKELDDRRFELHATSGDLDAPAAGTVQLITLKAGTNAMTLVRNDMLRVEATGEIVRVNADPTSDTQLYVVRGAAGSTPATVNPDGVNINPNLVAIGPSFEEGSLAPSGVNYDPTEIWNYTQIFRRTLEITGTAAKTKLRTEDALKEAKRECLEYISVDMERAFLLGRRHASVQNNKPIRWTNGIINQIDSNNITNFGGTVTMAEVEEAMFSMFKFGSDEKLMLGGNRALLALQQAVRKNTTAQWQVNEGIKEYGMKVTRFTTPWGEMVFRSHPLLTQNASGLNSNGGSDSDRRYYGMDTWAFILDMDDIKYVYMDGRDLQYQKDLQQNGMDGQQAGYLAECGIELHHAVNHGLWQNMYSGATD